MPNSTLRINTDRIPDQQNVTENTTESQTNEENQDFGNSLCDTGYMGYACNDCDRYADYWPDRYYNSEQYTCTKCDATSQPAVISTGVFVTYLLIGILAVLPFLD